MKTRIAIRSVRTLMFAVSLVTVASIANVGLAAGTAKIPIATNTRAENTEHAAARACAACKTTTVLEAVYGYFPGGEIDDYRYQWVPVGAKHTCGRCSGKITVVKGMTTDSMQQNCPLCGEGAPSCSAKAAKAASDATQT